MANIFTNFLRIVPHPGQAIGPDEAGWIVERVLNDRGSYNVPVAAHRASDGGLLDIQAGSRKNPYFHDFCEEHPERYAFVGERFFDDGGTVDTMFGLGPGEEWSDFGPCWYGFDEVRVLGAAVHLPAVGTRSGWAPLGDGCWQASLVGRYQTGNDRADIAKAGPCSMKVEWNPPVADVQPGGLATPTTPAYWDVDIMGLQPAALEPLVVHGSLQADDRPQVERVELLWRGRVVHRTQMEYDDVLEEYVWEQRSADDWDNCLNPQYIASMDALRHEAG
ncbi:hypothetical protein [Halostreptopolyspora alba]|uniref:Uncharacterized protein n=1 Tax=Halostreptopolyspora alba TaxID=2487137 RepID=A0A3N0EFH6_9ACTN|nr:hypothetical protein EFW17_05440 [Nocardiopsaceae bacterium YIM 96095]